MENLNTTKSHAKKILNPNGTKKWTKEDDECIIRMVHERKTASEMSEFFDVSLPSMITKLYRAQRNGLIPKIRTSKRIDMNIIHEFKTKGRSWKYILNWYNLNYPDMPLEKRNIILSYSRWKKKNFIFSGFELKCKKQY